MHYSVCSQVSREQLHTEELPGDIFLGAIVHWAAGAQHPEGTLTKALGPANYLPAQSQVPALSFVRHLGLVEYIQSLWLQT